MTHSIGGRGYMTLAVSPNEIRAAYALAHSIKLNDDAAQICIAVESFASMPTKYEHIFDFIVELPFGTNAEHSHQSNLWQLYYCTPFDETLYVNCYSLMLSDVSVLWEVAAGKDMLFSEFTENFRYQRNVKTVTFLLHEQNEIPQMYTDVFYFKKSVVANEFFKMLDVCSQNWREVYKKVLTKKRPDQFDSNVLINTALSMVGINEFAITSGEVSLYTYNCVDSLVLNKRSEYPNEWNKMIPIWIRDPSQIKVGNFKQSGLFVYSHPDVLTDEFLNDLKLSYKTTKKQALV